MSHFSENKNLTPVQHGFRSKHSCESQLLITTAEFIQNFESKTQTDVVVLDSSKAFDVVPHQLNLFKILKARHKQMLLFWILVRPLMLSPTNASCTNLTTMEFGEQLLIGCKIF